MLPWKTVASAIFVFFSELVLCRDPPPEIHVRSQPFVMLEHVNLNIPKYNETYRSFWVDTLGFVSDPRAKEISGRAEDAGGSMKGLFWANLGLQQIHMPIGEPEHPTQVLRGHLGIDYPDVNQLQKKLKKAKIEYRWGREVHRQLGYAADHLEFKDPQGNEIRAYTQGTMVVVGKMKPVWYGPSPNLAPTVYEGIGLPGGDSVGLGIRYVDFEIPQGAAATICKTYRKHFQAENLHEKSGICEVLVGFHQYLRFEEIKKPLRKYDGHHIAIYINKFIDVYKSFKSDGLIYNNPRFPHLTYDTLNDALDHSEFRFKDFVDEDSGEVVYTLEHEVRSLDHKQFSCKGMLKHHENRAEEL